MGKMSQHVGERIHLYRKARGLKIETLAASVFKSKSTISKYEQGSIVIDVDTLLDIAHVLEVSIHQLIDLPDPQPPLKARTAQRHKFFEHDILYMYYYDGRNNRLIRCVLDARSELECNRVMLFVDVEDLTHFQTCRHLYSGYCTPFDFVLRYRLENQANPVEEMSITILDPLSHTSEAIGMMSALSTSKYFVPVAIKCLFSSHILPEDDALLNKIILSKEEIKTIKHINMFTPYAL